MNQLTKGKDKRVMYVENKVGDIDGIPARVGWVTFSKTGLTIYYRGRTLKRCKGKGISGNYFDEATGEEYWVSGVKKRGENTHHTESTKVEIDDDAVDEYRKIKSGEDV